MIKNIDKHMFNAMELGSDAWHYCYDEKPKLVKVTISGKRITESGNEVYLSNKVYGQSNETYLFVDKSEALKAYKEGMQRYREETVKKLKQIDESLAFIDDSFVKNSLKSDQHTGWEIVDSDISDEPLTSLSNKSTKFVDNSRITTSDGKILLDFKAIKKKNIVIRSITTTGLEN